MKRITVLVLPAFLLLTSPVGAQDLLPRPLSPMESFIFNAGSGVLSSWGGGIQVGPYSGTMTSDPTQPALTLFCTDFAHHISPGLAWTANISNLGVGDVSQARVNDLAQYKKAAFLSSLFGSYQNFIDTSPGSLFTSKADVWSGIQAAIWTTLTPGFAAGQLAAGVYANPFVILADAAMVNNFAGTGLNFSEWSVVTDKNASGQIGGVEEFLIHTSVVPEPETVFLMLTGLLVVGVGALKFRMLDTG